MVKQCEKILTGKRENHKCYLSQMALQYYFNNPFKS